MDHIENNAYVAGWAAPVFPKGYSQRLNYFNMARGLFPYTSGPDAKAIDINELLAVAEKIKEYLEGSDDA